MQGTLLCSCRRCADRARGRLGRCFAAVDEAAGAAPSPGGKPRARGADGRSRGRGRGNGSGSGRERGRGRGRGRLSGRRTVPPAIEPRARAAGIDRGSGVQVFAEVEQDVDQRAADLARCGEEVRVEPVLPDAPAAPARPVDRTRTPHGQPLHTARERQRAVRFDDEVHVVRLHREMQHTKEAATGRPQRPPQPTEHPRRPQRRNIPPRPKRHMHRMPRHMPRPRAMSRPWPCLDRLPPRPPPRPAPGSRQGQGQLSTAPGRCHGPGTR
jgi:hypothetical protein